MQACQARPVTCVCVCVCVYKHLTNVPHYCSLMQPCWDDALTVHTHKHTHTHTNTAMSGRPSASGLHVHKKTLTSSTHLCVMGSGSTKPTRLLMSCPWEIRISELVVTPVIKHTHTHTHTHKHTGRSDKQAPTHLGGFAAEQQQRILSLCLCVCVCVSRTCCL